MCGIFGITENNKKLVKDMMHKCSHRGLMVAIYGQIII